MVTINETKDIKKLEGWTINKADVNTSSGRVYLYLYHKILEENLIVEISPLIGVQGAGHSITAFSSLLVKALPYEVNTEEVGS